MFGSIVVYKVLEFTDLFRCVRRSFIAFNFSDSLSLPDASTNHRGTLRMPSICLHIFVTRIKFRIVHSISTQSPHSIMNHELMDE